MNNASVTLTHTDPKSQQGAWVIALLAWVETRHPEWSYATVHDFISNHVDDCELLGLLSDYTPCPKRGVTGYIYDTVPAVYQAWQKYRHAPLLGFDALINSGGDTDSCCAIFGGIVGVRHANQMHQGIQGVWCEPKLTPKFFALLAHGALQAYAGQKVKAPKFGGFVTLIRNLLFLMVVLLHGLRRLLPPY